MPAKCCSVCGGAIIKAPIAVVEISSIKDGRPRLERAILCPECADWARIFTRARPVVTPGESVDLPTPVRARPGLEPAAVGR